MIQPLRSVAAASPEPTPLRASSAPVSARHASVQSAGRTIGFEAAGLQALQAALEGPLGEAFARAVETISASAGRVIVSGMGKSGHIGRKLAATMASTGTPAFFVHPAEASHGDLGMITSDDVVLALSWSGETAELRDILHYAHRFRVPVVAITSRPESALAEAAEVALILPRATEACPHGLAPTTSTAMQLTMGDALAVALLESRKFTPGDFKRFHPGGKLGAVLTFVRDAMHSGASVPLVTTGTPMSEALLVMTAKSFGCVGVTDGDGDLIGIVTDGDLRRHMGPELTAKTVDVVMSRSPRTVAPDDLAASALSVLQGGAITTLFVVHDRKPVGVLHVQDLLKLGVA